MAMRARSSLVASEGFIETARRRQCLLLEARIVYTRGRRSAGENPRSEEEEKFLGLHGDRRALEEMADQRDAADQRHLLYVGSLRRNHDSADDHGAAVVDQHLRLGGLGIQCGDALYARNTRINRGV